jgi:ribonuclease HII
MKQAFCSAETEGQWFAHGYRYVVGVDEVGRGPLAGPVVAAAATILPYGSERRDEVLWRIVRDSKTLSPSQRDRAYAFILKRFVVGIGRMSVQTIDRVNILQASFLAMKSALADLRRKTRNVFGEEMFSKSAMVLIDGNMEVPNVHWEQRAIVSGDSSVLSIAAASIVAKVVRDREMIALAKMYPKYGFDRHKGYGTREHMEALRRFGPLPEHRTSFAPVRKALRYLNGETFRKR